MPIKTQFLAPVVLCLAAAVLLAPFSVGQPAQGQPPKKKKPKPQADREYQQYGIYAQSAPRPEAAEPVATSLPLELKKGDRIAFIGNTLLERANFFGQFETLLYQRFPEHDLVVRNLTWSADAVDVQPRPANFADVYQHLKHEKIDVIFAAFGFNESFAGEAGLAEFEGNLTAFLTSLKAKSFNGKTAPQIVLVSPIANENVKGVNAGDLNNAQIELYTQAMKKVAAAEKVGFANVFDATKTAASSAGTDITINGCHLNKAGYGIFANTLYEQTFGEQPPEVNEAIRAVVVDKNTQYFRRYRPLNTFYYTGGRNKSYGYLDFLPAMRNFDMMVANRDQRIWDLAQGKVPGKEVPEQIDDSNIPPLPEAQEARGGNEWMSAADELKAFKIDPRFEVNLFAGEEEFPEIACPIQMRWDSRGRLWVSCSTTYPHVYPGNEPNDKLVILEDTDGDGKADKSTVFADNLHIPLSFEFGDGGVYVSDMPNLTFLKDTDGDDKADESRVLLSGFGTEDSHHALHDFAWTPDGDLIFRESVFHHSQVETPYGPVRQQNSGWFRYRPSEHRLTSFGTYSSTNPWGVTFDDWGQHMASHPVYAAAFHARDPEYPQQHPRPAGLQAYSGVCGQEFVDFATFPKEMQGDFIKVRYKPTNRVEIHHWKQTPFGFEEEYVSDLIFSSNLSFIPVDLRYGPRGAMYICDWYNPIKGHAQYSLRDSRRDRHSGRIWRITTKGKALQEAPNFEKLSVDDLLEMLKRPEYRYRHWAKRELRERDHAEVKNSLDVWVTQLDPSDKRFRHHQIEAVWTYRWIDKKETELLRSLLVCENEMARAAATQQLRYWHADIPDAVKLLRRSANDPSAIVRMQAAIAASYIGSKAALDAMLDVFKYPRAGHLQYAIITSLGSESLKRHWAGSDEYNIEKLLRQAARAEVLKEPPPTAGQAQFDSQQDLQTVKISCVPERMLFTVKHFGVKPGQPVKLVFSNPDATDHNLVIVKPGTLAEVGIAANEMAKDPRNANSDFHPREKAKLILEATPMIGPTRKDRVTVLRFNAPIEPGLYPYVCTFPGHWIVMNGIMVVTDDQDNIHSLLAAAQPPVVSEWKLEDFPEITTSKEEASIVAGMQAFVKARCQQCHVVGGHGVNLGPNLEESVKKLTGKKLLEQILEPSSEIHPKFQSYAFLMATGQVVTGVIMKEDDTSVSVATNLLTPNSLTKLLKKDIEAQRKSKLSPMPPGLANVLTKQEIMDLLSFLEAGDNLPAHLKHGHGEAGSESP